MFCYHLFGMDVRSDVAFDGIPEIEPTTDGEKTEVLVRPIPETIAGLDGGDDLVARAEGVLRFRITGGRRLVVDPDPEADPSFVRAMLVGEIMAALLRQRGHLVLHGAAVALDGSAIGFMGNSGWGKSTLATYFSRRGYTLLTDDVLAVDLQGDEALVLPGPSQVKLHEDVGRLFVEHEYGTLQPVHGQTRKRLAVREASSPRAATPLRKLYVLEPTPRAEAAVVDLRGRAAFVELLRHTRAQRLFTAPAYRARHLEQCQQLLRRVPMGVLRRPRSLERLGEVADTIERDLAHHPSRV